MTKKWEELREVEFIDKRAYSLGEMLEKCTTDPTIYILYYSEYVNNIVIIEPRLNTLDKIWTHYLSQNSVFIRLKEQYSTEIIKEEIK